MSKPETLEDRLSRIADAGERQAAALEAILKLLSETNFVPTVTNTVTIEEVVADAPNADEAAAENTPVEETSIEEEAEAFDAAVEEVAEAEAAEANAERLATAGSNDPVDDIDPIDGDPIDGTTIVVPDKVTTDMIREIARKVMAKFGKPKVFEVLAKVGENKNYKAVGEVSPDDLPEAFVKLTTQLNKEPDH